ncbi:hypothetical protein AnigIFM60653_001480 [Aspergillus niger]|nr:hypothetical protein AnigIFM60653_001480 [Aspergillus niger]
MPSSASGLPTPPASPLPPSSEQEKTPPESEEETPPVVNPSQQGMDLTPDLGYSIFGRRRRPSRRLLESLGKVYTAGALNTAPARQVDPATFHEAVSGPNQLEWSYQIRANLDDPQFVHEYKQGNKEHRSHPVKNQREKPRISDNSCPGLRVSSAIDGL